MTWGHNALAADLADHLRGGDRLVWTDMQIGPSGSPRPDVYTVPKVYSRFTPIAYEVKVSTSDFRRDVTAGKWQAYLKYASAVIFAVPAGLVGKADIPPGCGLIVRHDAVWRTAKGPTLGHCDTLPREAWMKLLLDGAERAATRTRARDRDAWGLSMRARAALGVELAKMFENRELAAMQLRQQRTKIGAQIAALDGELQEARARATAEAGEVVAAQAAFAEVLGLEPAAPLWQIKSAIKKRAAELQVEPRIVAVSDALRSIRWSLERAEKDVAAALPAAIEPIPAAAE